MSKRRHKAVLTYSTDNNGEEASSSVLSPEEEEARIEALEARSRKGSNKRGGQGTAGRRQIPIRGMTPPQAQQTSSGKREWKEGKLFPEGWEELSLPEKITELYVGERGVLFWANKAAYASVIGLIVAWICFRFVGPSLGLYELKGDLLPPRL